jgi:hypothetical protein
MKNKKVRKSLGVEDSEDVGGKKKELPTKEEFLKALDKVILTVKKPKSPSKGKKGTSG